MGPDDVPVIPWADFRARFSWRQGEHIALVGPTGQGKTTLALELLPLRDWTTILATKPRDRTLAGLQRSAGYRRIDRWPPPSPDTRRVLLWPPWRRPADTRRQSAVIHEALLAMFEAEAWTIFADDVQYLTSTLGLAGTLKLLWLQARALNISVVAATQRPRWVPLEMWSQSSHLFLWQTADEDDLRRLGGLGGISSRTIRAIVARLPRHHALYVNARDGALAVTKAERT